MSLSLSKLRRKGRTKEKKHKNRFIFKQWNKVKLSHVTWSFFFVFLQRFGFFGCSKRKVLIREQLASVKPLLKNGRKPTHGQIQLNVKRRAEISRCYSVVTIFPVIAGIFFWTGQWTEAAGRLCSNCPIRSAFHWNLKVCAALPQTRDSARPLGKSTSAYFVQINVMIVMK